MVAFYYNVWKLKGCEEARNWYDAGCPLGMLMGKPGEVTFKQPQDENRAEADPATQPKRLDGAASMYPETRTVLNSHRAAAAAAAFGLEPDTDMIPSMISSGRDQVSCLG